MFHGVFKYVILSLTAVLIFSPLSQGQDFYKDPLGKLKYIAADNKMKEADNISSADWKITGAQPFLVKLPDGSGEIVDAARFGVSPENPKSYAAIKEALEYCKRNSARKLIIPPGRYYLPPGNPVLLRNMSNFEFDGNGAVFVSTDKGKCKFGIVNCSKIHVKNFTIEWDWEKDPLASLIRVLRTGFRSVEFEFIDYKEFPKKDVKVAAFVQWDPEKNTIMETPQARDIYVDSQPWVKPVAKTSWLSPNRLRLEVPDNRLDSLRNGQILRLFHYRYHQCAFYTAHISDCTVENVRIAGSSGAGFNFMEKVRNLHLKKCAVSKQTGSRKILCSTTADHCFISGSTVENIMVEDCVFKDGGDDVFNIHPQTGFGFPEDSNTVALPSPPDNGYIFARYSKAGDKIMLRSELGEDCKTTMTVKEIIYRKGKSPLIVFIEQLPPCKGEGFLLYNQSLYAKNLIFRNNDLNARMILQCTDITFENNVLRGGWLRIESSYQLGAWYEGTGVKNAIIRNNRFENANRRNNRPQEFYPGGISVGAQMKTEHFTSPYPIHSRLLFENNTFMNPVGPAIFLSSAEKVIIRDNLVISTRGRKVPRKYSGSILLRKAFDIQIGSNTWRKSPYLPTPGVFIEIDTTRDIRFFGMLRLEE